MKINGKGPVVLYLQKRGRKVDIRVHVRGSVDGEGGGKEGIKEWRIFLCGGMFAMGWKEERKKKEKKERKERREKRRKRENASLIVSYLDLGLIAIPGTISPIKNGSSVFGEFQFITGLSRGDVESRG